MRGRLNARESRKQAGSLAGGQGTGAEATQAPRRRQAVMELCPGWHVTPAAAARCSPPDEDEWGLVSRGILGPRDQHLRLRTQGGGDEVLTPA